MQFNQYQNSPVKQNQFQTAFAPSFVTDFEFNKQTGYTQFNKPNILLKESQLKILQLESDIKLKDMKLQLFEQQAQAKIYDYIDTIRQLQEHIQKIQKEKSELFSNKDDEVNSLNTEINSLEQELIQAKLDVANYKSQLQEEKNKALILKRQITDQSKVQQVQVASKGGNSRNLDFLKNLKLENKAKTFSSMKNSFNEDEEKKQSQNYADHLVEHQEQWVQLKHGQNSNSKQFNIKEHDKDSTNLQNATGSFISSSKPDSEYGEMKTKTFDDEDWNDEIDNSSKLKEALRTILRGKLYEQVQDKEKVKQWVEQFLPKMRSSKDQIKLQTQKKFKEALKKGIPPEIRGVVWQELIGNELKITQKLYEILLDKAKISIQNGDRDPNFKKNLKVIEEDLHRTFGDLGHFKFGNKLYQPLKNILLAFSVLRPDLGYVQGMSYVAGSMLLHCAGEYDAFKCFSNLMNRDLLFHFYSFDTEKINIIFHMFMRIMKEKLPKMHNLFTQTSLSCSVFLFEWIVTLYANIFPLEMSARIWDQYLHFGDYHLLKIAIAICQCLEQSVTSDNFEMLVILFKNVRNFINEDILFKALESIKFDKQNYDQLKKQLENTDNLERLI